MKIRDLQVNEIDRRGFLKGLGAAAIAGATGNALSAPFKHGEHSDQMTGVTTNKYASVISNDGKIRLTIQHSGNNNMNGVFVYSAENFDLFSDYNNARMKINGKVSEIGIRKAGERGNYKVGEIGFNDPKFGKKLLQHNGELILELPIYIRGETQKKMFVFNLEQDNNTQAVNDKLTKDETNSKIAYDKKIKQMESLFIEVVEYNNKLNRLGKYKMAPTDAPRYYGVGFRHIGIVQDEKETAEVVAKKILADYKESYSKKENEADAIKFINNAKAYLSKSQNSSSTGNAEDNIRADNLKRMAGDDGYANRITARIKPNITFSGQIEGNPVATVEVRAGKDGGIISRRITNSSGNSEWDNAVLKAIDKTAVLPRDSNGQVPPTLQINFRPKD